MRNDEDKTINSHPAGAFAAAAAMDIERRNAKAYKDNQEFYDDPDHSARVDAVRAILKSFFGRNFDLYENQRPNCGDPYTALKVTNHTFPVMSFKRKEADYTQPLKKLGVVTKFMKGTNSYVYEVR